MNIINKIKQNELKYLIPSFAIFSLFTWLVNIPQTINIIVYLLILLTLIIFKFNNITILIFTLFSLLGNRTPYIMDREFSKVHFLYPAIFIASSLYFIIYLIINKKKNIYKLLLPMTLFIVYSFISLIWSLDPVEGLSKITLIIQGYFIYFVITNTKEHISFNYLSWFLSLFLFVLSVEFFTLAYQYTNSTNIIQNLKQMININKNAYLTLWANPNLAAAIFGIGFVPSLYKYFNKQNSKYTYLYIILDLFVIFGMILTQSRGLYFGLLIGLIVAPIILLIKNAGVKYTIFNGMILATLVFIIAILVLQNKYNNLYIDINKISSGRFTLYNFAYKEILNKPILFIFGQGTGSVRGLLRPLGHGEFYLHSFIINLLYTTGIIGTIFIFLIHFNTYKILKINGSLFAKLTAIAIFIYVGHELIDIGYDYQFLGVLLYFIIAVIEKDNERKAYNEKNIISTNNNSINNNISIM